MFRQPRPPDPDQDLVTRAQQGDTRAFDALILKYGDKLYGLVYNMTSHKEDTHDLLQEIFARAYQSLGKFRGNSAFYTWIYQIAVNLTLNFLKKKKRRTQSELERLGFLGPAGSGVDRHHPRGQSGAAEQPQRASDKIERSDDEVV